VASPAASDGPATRALKDRLLSLAFASSVGLFAWSLVGGAALLISLRGSLPFGGDPLEAARSRAARGDLAGAVREYRMAALIEPGGRAIQEMAPLIERLGRPEQAAAVFEELLRREPHDIQALNWAGNVRLAQGRNADAIGFYRRVLELSRDQAAVLNNLGTAYAASGDLDHAIEAFSAALALAPGGIARQNLERAKAARAAQRQ
jgi:tetratricopeptide (TPR) repeat protein